MAERIQIVRATEEGDYEQSAMLLTVNDPWAKLGRTYAYSYNKVHNPEDELIVAKKGERVVGCLLLEMHSTLKAFVRALCVSAEYRSHGMTCWHLRNTEHLKRLPMYSFLFPVREERNFMKPMAIRKWDI